MKMLYQAHTSKIKCKENNINFALHIMGIHWMVNTWWIFRQTCNPSGFFGCAQYIIWIAWETRTVVFRHFYHTSESMGIILCKKVWLIISIFSMYKMWENFHLTTITKTQILYAWKTTKIAWSGHIHMDVILWRLKWIRGNFIFQNKYHGHSLTIFRHFIELNVHADNKTFLSSLKA